jgi:hypothetical protein
MSTARPDTRSAKTDTPRATFWVAMSVFVERPKTLR